MKMLLKSSVTENIEDDNDNHKENSFFSRNWSRLL
jgi:hypothetical protein